MIEQGLAWKIGDGRLCRIGRDPWVGCNESYALSPGLLRLLDHTGIFTLNQIEKIGHSSIWGQAWKSAEDLGLNIRWKNEWNSFVQELQRSNVRIKEGLDALIWAQGDSGYYSPKDGYSFLVQKKGWGNPEWWAKLIWKLNGPAKAKILIWCLLKRKVPTWDSLQARYLAGPGRCPLCKSEEESIKHLFLSCEVSKKIWAELSKLININAQLVNDSLDVAWKRWWESHPEGNMRALPMIFFWGVWIARNRMLFQDKATPIEVTTINSAAIYTAFPAPDPKPSRRSSKIMNLQEGTPWAFFDGASQNHRAGASLCIFFSKDHFMKASVGLGIGT